MHSLDQNNHRRNIECTHTSKCLNKFGFGLAKDHEKYTQNMTDERGVKPQKESNKQNKSKKQTNITELNFF